MHFVSIPSPSPCTQEGDFECVCMYAWTVDAGPAGRLVADTNIKDPPPLPLFQAEHGHYSVISTLVHHSLHVRACGAHAVLLHGGVGAGRRDEPSASWRT